VAVKPRKQRRGVPSRIDKAYRNRLRLADFMGRLTEDEVPIAKKLGVFKWDSWAKNRRQTSNGG